VVIAAPDQQHCATVLHVLDCGVRFVLLEKPMAVTLADCQAIVAAAEEHDNACVAICHVLRYSPLNQFIKRQIQSGKLGDILSIQHTEPVGYSHFAHSFVRGNWRNVETSACSLLTKCCHDMDLLHYWMQPVKVTKVTSMGSLRHFRLSRKPSAAGDAKRCVNCDYESQCPYSARKIYLEPYLTSSHTGAPVSVVVNEGEITEETIMKALEQGPYGRCVYECDNNVCDQQAVLMEYENGTTSQLTMVATTERICTRQTKVYGSLAELTGDAETEQVHVHEFLSKTTTTYYPTEEDPPTATTLTGHGNADYHLMKAFCEAVATNNPALVLTTAKESLESHRLVFLAEQARLHQQVIDVNDW
jgi:predicted dehydrogenase